jgi:hypothetical protein
MVQAYADERRNSGGTQAHADRGWQQRRDIVAWRCVTHHHTGIENSHHYHDCQYDNHKREMLVNVYVPSITWCLGWRA